MKTVPLFLVLSVSSRALAQSSITPDDSANDSRVREIKQLKEELLRISARLDALDKTPPVSKTTVTTSTLPAPSSAGTSATEAIRTDGTPGMASQTASDSNAVPTWTEDDAGTLAFFRGTTLNFLVDGYYGYNFNAPVGRVNLLRAYDVSSNSFSLNQVAMVVERLPTPAERFGGRVDLQFGQATDTLQGSSANEQRPQVYRNLFQGYGSYLAPVGSGLQVDFGKFASSLGNEGNYTKDQIAYSRAYSFNYLPFYHMGLRANYNVTPKVNVAYWLVNGANQTEDFNGFKSQAVLFTLKPRPSLSWTVNYYFGQEGRDVQPTTNPGIPTSPTQPGLPAMNVSPVPNGREHIFDSYATLNATKRLTLVSEADYVLNRTLSHSRPARVVIGSLAARYTLPKSTSVGGRFEYFDDRGGLFSGSTQALKEFTLMADRQIAPGFLARAEYRRDFSNRRFFLSDTPGALLHAQTTATLGLIYWWGTKQGSW